MSRIGKLPIEIPSGVTIEINDRTVNVKGPKGESSLEVSENVGLELNENELLVCPFWGQDDIKYGASVCRGCQAEIHYGRKWGNIFATGILLILIGLSFDS